MYSVPYDNSRFWHDYLEHADAVARARNVWLTMCRCAASAHETRGTDAGWSLALARTS